MDSTTGSEQRDGADGVCPDGSVESMPAAPPDEPVEDLGGDDSILADAPDTTIGKEQLLHDEEGRPGPGV
jgi:hypothetical protein